MSTGDFSSVIGYESGFGFDLNENLNLLFKSSRSYRTEHSTDPLNKIKYNYTFAALGVEYIPPLPVLDLYRVFWKSSLSLGGSQFEIKGNCNGVNCEDKQIGIYTAFRTGLQYNFTQIISPFFDLGYYNTFYNTAKTDLKISGWQFDFGVRFYLSGSRDYEVGY